MASDIPEVLFVCVHNAGRSQMAAAFFNQLAPPSLASAVSAGTAPGERWTLDYVVSSRAAATGLAENYVGLPFE